MDILSCNSTLIGGIFAVVGTLIGGFITYKFSRKLANENARQESGRRLREAFSHAELVMRGYDDRSNIREYNISNHIKTELEKDFPGQHAAKREFRIYLYGEEGRKFDKAWEEYQQEKDMGFLNYHTEYTDGKDPKEEFFKAVNKILDFAKPKKSIRYILRSIKLN